MQLPGITSGITGLIGGSEHAGGGLGQEMKLALPLGGGSGGAVDFGGKAGTDMASLLSNKTTEPAEGEKKGGLAGIAAKLSDATSLIPGISNPLKEAGKSDGSLGGMLKGLVQGGFETAKNSVTGILKGAMQGEVSLPMMAKNALTENYKNNEQTPAVAKTIANLV